MFDLQSSRKGDHFLLPLNENRFESINHFPAMSSRNVSHSCNLDFTKQVSREQYHKAFVMKQDAHKVDSNGYSPRFTL